MTRTVAALLGIVGMSVRVTLASQPGGACCQPQPVCCEPQPPVACCLPPVASPCDDDAPSKMPTDGSARSTSPNNATKPGPGRIPAPATPKSAAETPPAESSVAKPVSPPPLAVPAISPERSALTTPPAAAVAPPANRGRYGDDPLADPLRQLATPAAPAPATPAPAAETPNELDEAIVAPQPEPPLPAEPAQETIPATEAASDLFSEPPAPLDDAPATAPETEAAAEPQPETTDADQAATPEVDMDDLFGEPAAEEPADATPTDSTPPDEAPEPSETPEANEEKELDFDDLFGPSSSTDVLREPGGWASEAPRTWSNHFGASVARARVVAVSEQQVTLQDQAGAQAAFGFADLSDGDLAFLRRQIDARRAHLVERSQTETRLAKQSR